VISEPRITASKDKFEEGALPRKPQMRRDGSHQKRLLATGTALIYSPGAISYSLTTRSYCSALLLMR